MTKKSFNTLQSAWRVNHHFLKERLKEGVPFFGMHGTSGQGLAGILNSKKGTFEMMTFYDTDTDERALFHFYWAADYVNAYARNRNAEDPGAILLFDLKGSDKNITTPWEIKLDNGMGFYGLRQDDSDRRESYFNIEQGNCLSWRTKHNFSSSEFQKRFKGVIASHVDENYLAGANDSYSSITLAHFRMRFSAQSILAQAFDILDGAPGYESLKRLQNPLSPMATDTVRRHGS